MELKDMILSTLAELEEVQEEPIEAIEPKEAKKQKPQATEPMEQKRENPSLAQDYEVESISDVRFLQNVRERILVLFEGFQSPNNQNIEAKVDLTLNFLEYLLASIDEQLEKRESKLQP